MTFFKWSQTASADATADSTINWSEGQAPSSVNDSGRAMMAAAAKFRDDISGQIVTTGTSTGYVVASFQAFDTLADMGGKEVWFTPHTTNGATVTLNVDSLGAKPLRFAPGVELVAGVMVQGTPIGAVYNNGDAAWYLKGNFGNPFNIPLAGGMDFWGSTLPNSCFAFPIGQAISRTTYASLFAIMSTTYGTGDGSTTFNLPDKTGRISAMQEASATRLTSTYFGGNSTVLGAVGGLESHTSTLAETPTGITSGGSISVTAPSGQDFVTADGLSSASITGGGGTNIPTNPHAASSTASGTAALTSNNTLGNPHANVQPTIICNYIIRIL